MSPVPRGAFVSVQPDQAPDNPPGLDEESLRVMALAMETITPRMRRATLEFLWDKFVAHGWDQ